MRRTHCLIGLMMKETQRIVSAQIWTCLVKRLKSREIRGSKKRFLKAIGSNIRS